MAGPEHDDTHHADNGGQRFLDDFVDGPDFEDASPVAAEDFGYDNPFSEPTDSSQTDQQK